MKKIHTHTHTTIHCDTSEEHVKMRTNLLHSIYSLLQSSLLHHKVLKPTCNQPFQPVLMDQKEQHHRMFCMFYSHFLQCSNAVRGPSKCPNYLFCKINN